MRLLIERVKTAKCIIDNTVKSSINNGYLVYCAFEDGDDETKIDKALNKLSKLRIFEDENHKMNLSIKDVDGEVLLISSFSLFADLNTGNRPSFSRSLPFSISKPLYDLTVEKANNLFKLQTGEFGADMKIDAVNDGPVSVILDI